MGAGLRAAADKCMTRIAGEANPAMQMLVAAATACLVNPAPLRFINRNLARSCTRSASHNPMMKNKAANASRVHFMWTASAVCGRTLASAQTLSPDAHLSPSRRSSITCALTWSGKACSSMTCNRKPHYWRAACCWQLLRAMLLTVMMQLAAATRGALSPTMKSHTT